MLPDVAGSERKCKAKSRKRLRIVLFRRLCLRRNPAPCTTRGHLVIMLLIQKKCLKHTSVDKITVFFKTWSIASWHVTVQYTTGLQGLFYFPTYHGPTTWTTFFGYRRLRLFMDRPLQGWRSWCSNRNRSSWSGWRTWSQRFIGHGTWLWTFVKGHWPLQRHICLRLALVRGEMRNE